MTTVCITSEVEIDLSDYLDRITDAELGAEVLRRANALKNVGPKLEGDGMGGPDIEEDGYWIAADDLHAIRDAIKTKGSDSAMELVRNLVCENLGCIL